MKFVTHIQNNTEHFAVLINDRIYNTSVLHPDLPSTIAGFLQDWDGNVALAKAAAAKALESSTVYQSILYADANIIAPVPNPTSCRDGYAFRQHVAAARRNRKVDMIAEFDQYPIFYFTNHNAIQGPGDIDCMPDHFQKLDFELEAAILVKKKGRNITAAQADDYIAGYMTMNDMSARTLQMEEMLLNLGPAKGKDFSTVIGPILVTPDELAHLEVPCKANHIGKAYNLAMTCTVNGVQVSSGNMADMDWTFAEILERCAYGADILAGDVIGSGTVGTGCFLELNGTGLLNDPTYKVQWLQPGDVVEMTIDGLGTLSNTIKAVDTDWSILAQKKMDN
jgi:fumarylacetoacetate (FAA) hydrolase